MSQVSKEFAKDLSGLSRFSATDKAYRGFTQLHRAALEDGQISRRHKELMAVAVSIATHCEGCIAWHVSEAVRAGATAEEVAETVSVAIMMGGGPATYYGSHALRYLEEETSAG